MFITYYMVAVVGVQNRVLLAVVLLSFVALCAVFISKLAIDPLQQYVHNLQMLSKETLHELNLPISTITTNTQMLQKTVEDPKARKRISRIESACEMLKQRYNELDYLIKMQTKQQIKEHFLLDELLKERVAFVAKIYPHMEFSLQLTQNELFMDKIGFAKVIDNLLDNAVKYSGTSKKIAIELYGDRLVIRDYGIGMDAVALLGIFDNYYQVNRDMQGFGIGLAMVKRFCDENGIELIFDSLPNKGTTVTLEFKKDRKKDADK